MAISRKRDRATNELQTDALSLMARIDGGIEQERMMGAVCRHMNETDQPFTRERRDRPERARQNRRELAGCMVRPRMTEERVERRIREWDIVAIVDRIGHRCSRNGDIIRIRRVRARRP